MILESLPRPLLCAIAAWACFYGPGQLLLGRARSSLPRSFTRVLASSALTTLLATALAVAECFSLANLFVALAVSSTIGFAARQFVLAKEDAAGPGRRDIVGILVFAAALAAYWPAYPTFLGASDSTAYVAAGVSLARTGALGREDKLGPTLPLASRELLFDSMSQVFATGGPPYRRMPGGVLTVSLDAKKAWPAFFPVPSVWAAIFVEAGATPEEAVERAAPNYAPVFAALSLWAFWLLARAWLAPPLALAAVVLLGASAPFYAFARMPLSEPIAAWFLLSGLAVFASSASRPSRSDAMLAGAAFGAAMLTRIETGLLVAIAAALEPSLRAPFVPASLGRRGIPRASAAVFALLAACAIAMAVVLPGTWNLALPDTLHNAWGLFVLRVLYGRHAAIAFGLGAVALLVFALACRSFGWRSTLRWSLVIGALVTHAGASNWLYSRTPLWMSFAVGWGGLAAAALGALAAYRNRAALGGASVLLAVFAAVSLILFYNPHVYPTLPWGWRRYVPLLLPGSILFACLLVSRVALRSRVVAAALLAALAWPILSAGKPQWGQDFVGGAWEFLEQIDAAIPGNGVLLIDRELSPMMVAPALWFVKDRNNVTVPPTGSKAGNDAIPPLVWGFNHWGKPVYFLTRGAGKQIRTPRIRMTLLARIPVSLRFLEQARDRTPTATQRYMMPMAVYRLDKSDDPKGENPP